MLEFPSWITPEIFPGLPIRWYGLMYIFAFATAFLIYRKQVKERKFPMSDDQLSSLFFWGIVGLLLGARLFSTIIYDTSGLYRRQPWLIFWPFRDGEFTGLQGMSYHGGAFGGLLAVILYAKFKKISFREIGDMFAAAIPLGFTWGRLGNFFNAELYGRITSSPLGMLFPNARTVPASDPHVQEIAEAVGLAITSASVNLPRHPSQIYQALFEGVVLWAIIWFFRNRKPFKGFLIGLYFLGIGFFRFIIEYFREPDANLGFRITLGENMFFQFTTGQILSFLMIAFGVVWLIIASRLPNKEPIRAYGEERERIQVDKEETAKDRNKRRKLRKKLK